jgi:hypothetical protein
MNLWQKLTVDWPCTVGDWLWAKVVMGMVAFLERLTIKRIILVAGLLVLIFGFAQIFSIDLAFAFAADTIAYFDIASAVLLVVAQGHIRHALKAIRQTAQKVPIRLLRFCARQRRNVNAMRRKGGAHGPKQSDDAPGAWDSGLYAPA